MLQAGLAALEGRVGHAETGFRDALAAQRELGIDGDLAFSLLDAVRLLRPTSEVGRAAAEELDALIERLGAAGLRPILDGLVDAPQPAAVLGGAADVTCPSCGTTNRPGRKFCLECGSALDAACPSCGAPLEAGAKFCGECGARTGGTATPAAAGRAPRVAA